MVRVVLDISQNNARYSTVTNKPQPRMGVAHQRWISHARSLFHLLHSDIYNK